MRINLDDFKLKQGNGWLYRLYLNDDLVYIGMTIVPHPMGRICAHYKDKEFDSFEAEQHEIRLLPKIELEEIKKHRPKYNIIGVSGRDNQQWIHPNHVHVEMPSDHPYSRSEAVQYCFLSLKKKGFVLNPKQRESIYNKLPRWVWVDRGIYLKKDLDDFLSKIASGEHRI